MAKQKTKHQKEVELAKAGATKYAVQIDSTPSPTPESLAVLTISKDSILAIITSDSEEKTKRMALEALDKAIPSAANISVANCDFKM